MRLLLDIITREEPDFKFDITDDQPTTDSVRSLFDALNEAGIDPEYGDDDLGKLEQVYNAAFDDDDWTNFYNGTISWTVSEILGDMLNKWAEDDVE